MNNHFCTEEVRAELERRFHAHQRKRRFHAHQRKRLLARMGIAAAVGLVAYVWGCWLEDKGVRDLPEVLVVLGVVFWGIWGGYWLMERH